MRLRAPRPEEAERVLALLVARDTADLGRPDVTLGDLLDEWRGSELDLARNATVCELEDRTLAGYAVVRSAGTFGAVDPGHEGKGIGSALLEWCEARQRALGWHEHRTASPGGNQRAAALLRSRGYRVIRSYRRMVRDLACALQRAAPPAGVTLRALGAADDPEAIYELDRVAFADVAGSEPESLRAFTEEHLQAHDLDAGLSRVAERDGRLVGFLLTRRWEQESAGFVDLLAVDPREHGRGIGRALLLDVFAALGAAGLAEAQLGVADDNRTALRLYEAVGMRPRFQIDAWRRAVDHQRP